MPRCVGCWFLCLAALIWTGGPVRADEPAAKTEEPVAKSQEPVAKGTEPAKNGEPAVKVAEPPAKSAAEPAAAPPATYSVKKAPLKITIDLDGVFEAQTSHEIVVKPEEWTGLTVETTVPHGDQVRKGDVILSLDTEKIDRAIADLRTELKLSEVSLDLSSDQLQALEKTTPLDLEASQRVARIAEEDRKAFFDVELPFTLREIDFSLKAATNTLEYQEEELHQLEKMYKADDITEETEEIVLRRARDTVERAKFNVEMVQLSHDLALKFLIPRTKDMVKDSAQRKQLDWNKNKVEIPLALQKQRLEVEKSRVQRERSDDKLKKLLADREMMTVKSPADGIVYYGKCVRGKFSDSTSLGESLRRNGTIQPNQVVMTVVRPRPMFIRAAVPEDQLHNLRPALKGVATPAGFPDLKLTATIDRVSDVPTAPGSFDARLAVTLDRKAKEIMPGMACKVKLIPYLKKDAISVPLKCVTTDELDDQKQFVYILDKDGKPAKCAVTLGQKADKQIEILKGLAEGDKVLLEAPKDQK